MLLLYTNYTIIFWLLLGNSHADKHLLRQIADDQEIYGIASCTASCIQQKLAQQNVTQQQQQLAAQQKSQIGQYSANTTSHISEPKQAFGVNTMFFQHCCDVCKNESKKTTTKMRLILESLTLQLVCRDEKSLSFRINSAAQLHELNTDTFSQQLNSTYAGNTLDGIVYVIKLHVAKDAREYLVYLSDENFFTINGLQHNTTYAISVIAAHRNNTYSVISKTQPFTTLRRDYVPKTITGVQVLSFSEDKYSKHNLQANIEWKPSSDMNCDYDMISFSPENGEYVVPAEIREPRELYSYSIPNLTFSSEYKIGVRAKNRNSGKESDLFWHTFRAPSCEEWYNYNFSICPPLKPEGLNVEQTFITEDTLSLNITWLKPHHMPDYYIIHVLEFRENGTDHQYNVTQDANELYIPAITIRSQFFGIHLIALTAGGNSTMFAMLSTQQQIGMYVPDKGYAYKLVFVILAPILFFVILSLTAYVVYNRRAKLQRYQERCRYFEELEKKAPIDPKTFDFPPKALPAPIPSGTASSAHESAQHMTQFQRDLEEKFIQNDELEIDRNDLILHEVLGEGAFGLVRRGVYKQKNLGTREVAVKMLKDQPNLDEIRAFRHEIEVMKSVEQHPNIVSLIGHCTRQQGEIMLLTEYCSLGNLQSFLREEWAFLNELKNEFKKNGNLPNKPNEKKSKFHYFKQNLNLIQMQQQQVSATKLKIKPHEKPNKPGDNVISASTINSDRQIEELTATAMQAKITIKTNTAASGSASSSGSTTPTSSTATTLSRNSATDNKSYGYDEICTNSCKCHVDVIINEIDHHNTVATQQVANQLEQILRIQQQEHTTHELAAGTEQHTATTKSITIKNCECRARQKQLKAKLNEASSAVKATTPPAATIVENASYFHNQAHDKQPPLMDGANLTHALAILAERQPLSAADLLDIARQVALGMEYLGKNKVVHRDLAARNVLITSDRTIKIADFGLSRDIYQENIYKKTGNGKLPIKWLALESMTHQVYTTQSDVWSYGILLYEIVSLGGLPYPTIPANRLLHLLKSGYRMERPDNCGEELYALMHACWNAAPTERPTFTDIIKNIDVLSETAEKQITYDNIFGYVAKHAPAMQKIIASKEHSTTSNTEDYLQPV